MDKGSTSNQSDLQAQNSVYQRLDQVETRQKLKLSFPVPDKKVPPKPVQNLIPTAIPR